jgi:hypothetical protein
MGVTVLIVSGKHPRKTEPDRLLPYPFEAWRENAFAPLSPFPKIEGMLSLVLSSRKMINRLHGS